MPVAKKIIRGSQDIKTISGRAEEGSGPYKAYMKLSVLEMEKLRRGKEKTNSLARVANIDARFADIEKERMALLQMLGDLNSEKAPGIRKHFAKPGSSAGAFKIRY